MYSTIQHNEASGSFCFWQCLVTRHGVSSTPLGPQGALILVGLCSAWQGLLPGHCVTTGGDNKLLLCLTGLTACFCHCTRCLTLVRLLLLTTTLPLSCRTGSQVLLLLMICSCPGCVLLMCYSSMLRFSRSLLASTLSSLRRLNSGCHILMCHP